MERMYLIIVVSLFLFGCNNFLDENLDGKVIGEGVFSSFDGLKSVADGAYKGLNSTWSTGFMHGTAVAATMGGDDLTTHPASNKQEFREFDQFTVSNTNSRISQLYSGLYKTIQSANNVLSNYQNTEGDKDEIMKLVGEMYFLRGFSYFWLVRLYGQVPLITSATYSDELLEVELESTSGIYQQIEEDLQNAADLLPNSKREFGTPNKGSALAFLSDVYLTEAGWPLMDESKYELAAQVAKEVIDNASSYDFEFLPTFAEIFANDPSQNGTLEDIFNITANSGSSSSYNAVYGNPVIPEDIGGWDDYFAEVGFFLSFPDGPRKDATFQTDFVSSSGNSIHYTELITKHPHYKKFFVNGNYTGSDQTANSSLPLRMMRFTQVLLTYAEAKARSSDGPDTKAYEYLNMVRNRGSESSIPDGSLSSQAFADLVVQERAWEFAGEYVRWFDLIRLEMLEDVIQNKNPEDLQPLGSVSHDKYTFPLPQTETAANPNL